MSVESMIITRSIGRVFYTDRLTIYLPALTLVFSLFLGVFLLSPGLTGGFLFDDEPNLRDLGAYGGVVSWSTFKVYVFGGFAGPTGRPLSLLSFLIDDYTWPSSPYNFKRTNLALHLLTYVILLWATLQLARVYGIQEKKAQWLALLSASIWMIHPFQISTTFYIVQRMEILSALFSLAGITGYLYGRQLWPHEPKKALLWMITSLVTGTVTATFSKENGALLPVFLLTIEYCCPSSTNRLPKSFLIIFLYLPTLAIIIYLLSHWSPIQTPWPNRPFNQLERLLTEPRVIWDYLYNLFIPRIEGAGLFHDDIEISKGLLQPPRTLAAIVGVAVLFISGLTLRRAAPLTSLAILFYLSGHLIESTILNLELYFEHRNYLPSAFLFLPLASLAIKFYENRHEITVILLVCSLFVTLGFLTRKRATLWGDPGKLEAYWALVTPDSPRSANTLARHVLKHSGDIQKAEQILDAGLKKHPNNALLVLSRLQLLIKLGIATNTDFKIAAKRLETSPFDAQAITALRTITETVLLPTSSKLYRDNVKYLIQTLISNAHYNNFPIFIRLTHYLIAQLNLANQEPDEAEKQYMIAIKEYNDIDSAMQIVAEMGNANYPKQALRLLKKAEEIFQNQSKKSLKFDRDIYESEITRIRSILNDELQKRTHK